MFLKNINKCFLGLALLLTVMCSLELSRAHQIMEPRREGEFISESYRSELDKPSIADNTEDKKKEVEKSSRELDTQEAESEKFNGTPSVFREIIGGLLTQTSEFISQFFEHFISDISSFFQRITGIRETESPEDEIEAPDKPDLTEHCTELLKIIQSDIEDKDKIQDAVIQLSGVIHKTSEDTQKEAVSVLYELAKNEETKQGLQYTALKGLLKISGNEEAALQARENALEKLIKEAKYNQTDIYIREEFVENIIGIAENSSDTAELRNAAVKGMASIALSFRSNSDERQIITGSLYNIVISEENGDLRNLAVKQLCNAAGSINSEYMEKVKEFVQEFAKDRQENTEFRVAAVKGLAILAGKDRASLELRQSVIEFLFKIAENNEEVDLLRIETIESLGLLGVANNTDPADRNTIINKLASLLTDVSEYDEVRLKAVEKLDKINRNYYFLTDKQHEVIAGGLTDVAVNTESSMHLRKTAIGALSWMSSNGRIEAYIREEVADGLMEIVNNSDNEIEFRLSVMLSINITGIFDRLEDDFTDDLIEIVNNTDNNNELRHRALHGLLSIMNIRRNLLTSDYIEGKVEKYPFIENEQKEKVVMAILGNESLIREMDAGRKEEIAIGLWSFSEDLSDTARSEVRSYIEDNHINDINERVWNEFGVILVGDLDNVSEKNFYRTFALLLEEMLPPFVAYEDLPWPRINGIYSTPSREIRIDIEADSIPRVLFHEVGHYIHFGFNDKEKLETWSKLWDKSEQSVDYARKYGQRNIVEDFATMFEAYTFGNTRNFLAQTISNSYSGRDVRLRKIEFISGLFTHEAVLEGGSITEATYVYDVKKDDESGEYIFGRKAVALAEMEINGNIYILPDFERVLSETIL